MKIKSLRSHAQWKATECRQFILYLAPVVLEGRILKSCYRLTKYLSVGVMILSTPCLCQSVYFNERAPELLTRFVTLWTSEFFDEHDTVHCIHALVHLHKDVLRHGPLDAFSAYDFEDFFRYFKRG